MKIFKHKCIENSHESNIFCMSRPRRFVLDKLYSYTDELNKHVIECVVYSEEKNLTLDHWIKVIANWLCIANGLKCKNKLKIKDYQDTLFASFGNNYADAENNLQDYRLRNKTLTQSYPDFEITNDLVSDLYTAYQFLEEICIPIFRSDKQLTVSEWKSEIYRIFD